MISITDDFIIPLTAFLKIIPGGDVFIPPTAVLVGYPPHWS